MPLKLQSVHKILVISLTNIGDVVLTFPVIDILKNDFPNADLSLVVGPKAQSLVVGNPTFKKIYIFEKKRKLFEQLKWLGVLRREKFDLVVDLRNSAMPVFIGSRYRTSFRMRQKDQVHMRMKHLAHLMTVYSFPKLGEKRFCVFPSGEDEHYVLEQLDGLQKFIVVAPGCADSAKQWPQENFAKLCDQLIENSKISIVMAGDGQDRAIVEKIQSLMKFRVLNLAGKITLSQLAQLISLAQAVIANDSAAMHLASYLDKPVVGIFGRTDPVRYGPWSKRGKFVQGAQNQISNVQVLDVLNALKNIYEKV